MPVSFHQQKQIKSTIVEKDLCMYNLIWTRTLKFPLLENIANILVKENLLFYNPFNQCFQIEDNNDIFLCLIDINI